MSGFCHIVKKYVDIGAELLKAFTEYCDEVRVGVFPIDEDHTYKISDKEAAMLTELLDNDAIC